MDLKLKKLIFILISSIFVLVACFAWIFLSGLPTFISNPNTISYIEKTVNKEFGAQLNIDSPILKTNPKLDVEFLVNKIYLAKGKEKLLNIDDLNVKINLKEIFLKRVIVKRLSVESFYADVNKILALFPQNENKPQQKLDWYVDVMDALLYAKNVDVAYSFGDTHIRVTAKGFGTNNAKKVNRRVYFKMLVELAQNNENIKIGLWDQAKVFIDNKTLYINDLPIIVNGSKIYINAKANRKIKYNLKIHSKNFNANNVEQIINSNLIIPNGKELLAFAVNKIRGGFDFDINITPKDMLGNVNINRVTANIIPLADLPIVCNQGLIKFDYKNIKFENFKGYYRDSSENSIDFSGNIKDYTKSVDMNIIGNAVVTDCFMKEHMTKLVGFPTGMMGIADARIILKSKYNKFDIIGLFRLQPNNDVLVDGASISSIKRKRVIKADMHFEDMILKIKSIDYLAEFENQGKQIKKSIMNLVGNVDCATGKILDMGIYVPDPLPSEFFNVFVKQRLFKKGNITGKIHYINTGKYPVLDADMIAEDIRIPSQRLKIDRARIISDKKGRLHIVSKGKFKRSTYKVGGNINNNLTLPIIVNNIEMTVDNLDIERIMQSMNQQNTTAVTSTQQQNKDDDDDSYVFNTGLLIINDCNFHMLNAKYKDIYMGNLNANLVLDKDGVLKIKSNKFDFAEGISSLKVQCDLMKHDYYVRLGVKDVNSDLIASNLLGLEKQISGKAKGLIELNTDDSFKLNGKILFDIDDGTIGTVGYLEYLLKFVALFRNPLAMISPSTFIDLVNIPEGRFDCIKGELYLKNNIIELMKIKSRASQLSSFIIGRFDLDNHDAILRIYTKMSNRKKGFAGALRNISLNALANKLQFGNNADANSYALEIKELPEIDAPERDCQIFMTKIDGDVEHNNFISSLRRIR